jgi:hypothetical protein
MKGEMKREKREEGGERGRTGERKGVRGREARARVWKGNKEGGREARGREGGGWETVTGAEEIERETKVLFVLKCTTW